ncbi:MAG: hypothetical protein GF392_05585, partial [Candidatus Omnitrophica bacterium]|nr:hypothetical protein [Candidatus Omnitrophota bacterium]
MALVSVALLTAGPADIAGAAAGHVQKKEVRTGEEARKKEIEEQKRSDRFLKLFSRARRYKQEGKLKTARRYAEKALEVEPDNEDARRFLETMDTPSSEEKTEKTTVDEDQKKVRARLTEALVDTEKDDTARIRREQKISRRLEQARRAVEDSEPAAARTYLGQARALGADEDELLRIENEIADTQRAQGRKEASEDDTREKVGEYIDRAGEKLQDRDFSEARKAAGKALDLDPANIKATGLMSRIQRARLQYEREQRERREKERMARKKDEKRTRSDRTAA